MKRATLPRPPDTADWLAARAPFLGASEAGALFGEYPFRTLGEIALQKLGKLPRETENQAMVRGQWLEEAVAQWWAADHQEEVSEVRVLYVVGHDDDQEGALCATLDRHVIGKNVALEVKTTAQYVDRPLRYWWHQCQAQILCADLDYVELAVMDASQTLQSFRIDPDREHMEEMLTRAVAFVRSIRLGMVPEGARVSIQGARQLYPEAGEGSVTLDETRLQLLGHLRQVRQQLKDLHQEEELLAGDVALAIGQCSEAKDSAGNVVATWRNRRDVRLDTKALKAEHPDLHRHYSKVTKTRELRLK